MPNSALSVGSTLSAPQLNSNNMMDMMDYQNQLNTQYTHEQWKYNSAEADKNRAWLERMSNTAHQREAWDLMEAGLNPVLTALNGNGASTPQSSPASGTAQKADTSALSAYANIMVAGIQASSAARVAEIYTENQRWMAEHYPSTMFGTINAMANGLTDGSAMDGGFAGISKLFGNGVAEAGRKFGQLFNSGTSSKDLSASAGRSKHKAKKEFKFEATLPH